MAQTQAAAQAGVPASKLNTAELKHEDEQFNCSSDLKSPDGIKEISVDAMTGKVVKVGCETTAKEKAEEVQEANAATQKKANYHWRDFPRGCIQLCSAARAPTARFALRTPVDHDGVESDLSKSNMKYAEPS